MKVSQQRTTRLFLSVHQLKNMQNTTSCYSKQKQFKPHNHILSQWVKNMKVRMLLVGTGIENVFLLLHLCGVGNMENTSWLLQVNSLICVNYNSQTVRCFLNCCDAKMHIKRITKKKITWMQIFTKTKVVIYVKFSIDFPDMLIQSK